MKNINAPHKFLIYALGQAIRHPRQPIKYLYCPDCRLRFPGNSGECPSCGKKVKSNPGPNDNDDDNSPDIKQESAVPWWGALICIVIGIAAWITGACVPVPGLDEAARALVYIPLGSLFGMSVKRD